MIRHLDLFSGIGGFSLAASWVWGDEHEIVAFVEIDPFCQKVLKKHWPDVPIHDNIRTYKYNGTDVDLLTGGFPCQPYSIAGKRRGKKDDRDLWPEMFRVIREVRPTWVIGENVANFVNMELERTLSDLESASYEVQGFLIPACGVGAPHKRERCWIVGHSIEQRLERHADVADTTGILSQRCGNKQEQEKFGRESRRHPEPGLGNLVDGISQWLAEPNIPRVATGVPDRVNKIKALGNSIVPQTVVPIFEAIKSYE